MNKVYKKVAEEISPLILVASLVLTSVLITFTANAETIMEVESVTIIGSKEDVKDLAGSGAVSYTHLRAHETKANLVCRLLLDKKKKQKNQ